MMKLKHIGNVLKFISILKYCFDEENQEFYRFYISKKYIHLRSATPELAFKYLLKEENKPRNMIF